MRAPAALTRLTSLLAAPLERPDVYVVFMEYTSAHRASGWEVLRPFVGRLFPGCRVRWVVVDNAYARSEDVPPQDGAEAIAGDGSCREFSGLDAGIAHVRRRWAPGPQAVFLLVNDTFHRSYGTEYLARFARWPVRAALRRGEAVGYVDAYPTEFTVLGLPLRWWIRTSVVIVRAGVLEAVGPLALPVGDDRLFASPGADRFFRDDAPLSENYRGYVRTWLFGEASDGYAERWHSGGALTPENAATFRAKARSIICEHYFSARLRKLGVRILPVNLSRKRARRSGVW